MLSTLVVCMRCRPNPVEKWIQSGGQKVTEKKCVTHDGCWFWSVRQPNFSVCYEHVCDIRHGWLWLHWGITKFGKTLYMPYYHFHQSTPLEMFSEIKGKITRGKPPRTHILSKKKKSNISSIFYFPICEVTNLSRQLRQLSHLKHHSFQSRDWPQLSPLARLPM